MEYQIQVPRRSPLIQPASRSTLRWWEVVGWLTPQQPVRSQAHVAPPAESCRKIDRRVGSAMACSNRTSGSLVFFTLDSISIPVYIDNYRYVRRPERHDHHYH